MIPYDTSMDRRVWFVTGASRGMGAAFTGAALEVGDAVVATGRRKDEILSAHQGWEHLLAVTLDVTNVDDAFVAAEAAMDRFGRIDVLVNNAGSSFKGYFEEMSPRQVDQQLATNLLGPMNVTRAVLPVMRRTRRPAVGDQSSRPDERHPCCPAGDAAATVGACHLDLLGSRSDGFRVLVG